MTTPVKAEEQGLVKVISLPDQPLVSAKQAKQMWETYQELESTILTDEDYLWFVEWEDTGGGKRRIKRTSFPTRAAAENFQKRRGGTLVKRKVKSACRKLGKYFGYEIPEVGHGEVEVRKEGDYILQIERGDYYTFTEWLDTNLQTIKSSATVFIRSPNGRTWMGRGGAHRVEGFAEDFAIGGTAFTRAVNRAILDAVGFGDESAEETPAIETRPGVEEDLEPPGDVPPEDPGHDTPAAETPNFPAFWDWCEKTLGLGKKAVLAQLGLKDDAQILPKYGSLRTAANVLKQRIQGKQSSSSPLP